MARNGSNARIPVPKAPSGIQGLDAITNGGLPRGRTTLVVGSPGCGKTLLAMQFLAHGVLNHNEPGVCLQFEETAEKLAANVRSLGLNLDQFIRRKKLLVDHIRIDRNEIEETGAYNLDGIFIRLGHAVQSINAKRVVLDGIETLFAGLSEEAVLRSELRRLFRWLDEHNLTAIVTGERGDRTLSRHGLEEYIADCVIVMDHRITNQISTRRLRIVKYRGSSHGTDEYPFLIDDDGISLIPITGLELTHTAVKERVSTGIPALDEMMEGKGFYRGSSVLVSGRAGTGKSTLAAKFADAACGRGKSCLYFAFEESPSQIIRNMASVGIRLERWVRKGSLKFHATRPTSAGLEAHLAVMQKLIADSKPDVVIVDPITSIFSGWDTLGTKLMFTRLIDFLKVRHITSMFNHLTLGSADQTTAHESVSTLMDTWITVTDHNHGDGEPKRGLLVVKSRGMAHSRERRELVVSKGKITLGGVLRNHAPSQEVVE
ncbi:MAG TPA: circadian clock protein KaiC [Bryobacteraceae bacterium]|nr:circadian clock protein KaiC [Bryobacteraceae bacterium]